jgi:hypothetical protein
VRTFTKRTVVLLAAVIFTINAGAHGHEVKNGQNHRLMDLVGASDERYMMMVQIAKNPELRSEMIQRIMQSMSRDADTDIGLVMNDPEVKARMQEHVSMMQITLDSNGMDSEEMKAVTNNPQMMSMMKMHLIFAQMTTGGAP